MQNTKAIVIAIRQDLVSKFQQAKQDFKSYWQHQIESGLVKVVGWALSKRSVQHVVAGTFSGGTPMCDVLRDAIESNDRHRSVDADDIEGLDRAIESAIESAAMDERWVKDAVEEAIDIDKIAEEVSENESLLDHIADELSERVTKQVVEELIARLQH